MRTYLYVVLLPIVLLSTAAMAAVPGQVSYQGTLTDDGGVALDTTVAMTFTIYNDSTATFSVWAETQPAVEVSDGVFNVLLGSVNPISEAVFPGAPRWLGVQVGGDPEMSPLHKLVSVPYAFHAAKADTAGYALGAQAADSYWSVTDSVLSTDDYWGLARGGVGNALKGDGTQTHINLGNSSTTGESGQNYSYCTVAGGWTNTASHGYATVGGGGQNTASELSATVGGGHFNTASNQRATVAGGWANTASGYVSTVGGGYGHLVAGDFSAILGGLADTITATADRSYLFGIASKLTQDSTFAVDMPHIRFGDEADGYEFPTSDGIGGQIMMTDGSGRVSWSDIVADNDWVRGTPDSVLFTANHLGIARGSAGNMLYGTNVHTHNNLGVACTTGTSGQDYSYCTVSGGWGNNASSSYGTVAGGYRNTAISQGSVGGGYNNLAGSNYATVSGGRTNTASSYSAAVGGGYQNTASNNYTAVMGGRDNIASGEYAAIAGGMNNTAGGSGAAVAGGSDNTASGAYAAVAGGRLNFVAGSYSAILGGYADTITAGAHLSYLFGMDSKLTQDSTFAVDMPHIRFGDEADGYEMPTSDGAYGEIMVTDGSGQVSWANVASDDDWTRGTPDSVLFTVRSLGLSKGNAGNMLYGTNVFNHNNLGYACTTGAVGQNHAGCTVGGGYFNSATDRQATIAGGHFNIAASPYSTVSGGRSNRANSDYAIVAGGYENLASGSYSTVSGGSTNLASGNRATVAGGYCDTSKADGSFSAGNFSKVGLYHSNSAAFNGQATTASGQTRVGALSKVSGTFTIDHPLDPLNTILNHYFVESPEMVLIYRGAAVLGADGRAAIDLPDYFDALNENPMVQLTGVGTFEVFVAEEVKGNSFVIGGKPGTKVYWTVTGGRKDPSAEITKILMPVEQPKEGSLANRSLDDDFLATTLTQLERMGQTGRFSFRTQRGRARYEEMKRGLEMQKPMD